MSVGTRREERERALSLLYEAEAKAHADMLKVFEVYLASQRRYRLSNPPKSAAATSHPNSPNPAQITSPNPAAAPVTSATLPDRSKRFFGSRET